MQVLQGSHEEHLYDVNYCPHFTVSRSEWQLHSLDFFRALLFLNLFFYTNIEVWNSKSPKNQIGHRWIFIRNNLTKN